MEVHQNLKVAILIHVQAVPRKVPIGIISREIPMTVTDQLHPQFTTHGHLMIGISMRRVTKTVVSAGVKIPG